MPVAYQNIAVSERVSKTQAGWSALKQWIIDDADMSDPDSTIATVIESDLIPNRGDSHPSGQDMQADEINGEAITSTQIRVTVSYKKLSAVEMEPDESRPALMTIGSSVQQQRTCVGKEEDEGKMAIGYFAENGAPVKFIIKNALTGAVINNPTCKVQCDIQIPNTVIHFARREKNPPTAKIDKYVGRANKTHCSWGDLSADNRTLLCTRIEGTTNDGGNSYIVDYEFQYHPDSWNVNAFYTLPVNTYGEAVDGGAATCGAGNIPDDADFGTFTVYEDAEFNSLNLYGAK